MVLNVIIRLIGIQACSLYSKELDEKSDTTNDNKIKLQSPLKLAITCYILFV